MNEHIKQAIEKYQCCGCLRGSDTECYSPSLKGVACDKHLSGTLISGVGWVFLGMPKGFNRLGENKQFKMDIFETQEDRYRNWVGRPIYNIVVWKYLSPEGHVFLRGLMPRLNIPFLHVILDKRDFDSIEAAKTITAKELEYMG